MNMGFDKIFIAYNNSIADPDWPEPLEMVNRKDLNLRGFGGQLNRFTESMINPFNIDIDGNLKTEKVNRFQFNTMADFEMAKDLAGRSWYLDPLEQIYIKHPDWYCAYPHTNALNILYVDIEVGSDGGALFPKAERSPILLIGYAVNDGDIQIIPTVGDGTDDLELCKKWLEIIKDVDPDVIVTYNGRKFDLPFLEYRCETVHELDIDCLKRVDKAVAEKEDTEYRFKGKSVTYAGRVEFDLFFDGVDKDTHQRLMGLPNRKMKTVAKAYDIEVGVELEDVEARDLMTVWNDPDQQSKLFEYLKSDVHITRELCDKVYLRQRIGDANLNRVPLAAVMDTYKSFFPKLMSARAFHKRGYLAVDKNTTRYDGRHGTIYKAGNTVDDDAGIKYQGANVAIKKKGRFTDVYHVDFSSFYPTTIRTFNLSPESCHFIPVNAEKYPDEVKLTDPPVYSFKNTDTELRMSIPDSNLKRQVFIKVRNDRPGFLAEEIAEALETRLRLKRSSQDIEDKESEEAIAIDSWQLALKILINSIYGLEGQQSSEYGSLPVAIATVGLCRFVIDKVATFIGEPVIEIDTDGIYVDRKVDIDAINAYIKEVLSDLVPDKDSIIGKNIAKSGEEGFIGMEIDGPYPVGVFYGMKNYILQNPGSETLTVSGSAFKNSRHSRGVKQFIHAIAVLQIADADKDKYRYAIDGIGNPMTWDLEDFACSAKLGRDPDAYGDFKRIVTSLSEQLEVVEDIMPMAGDQIEFFYTRTSWHQRTGHKTMSQSRQVVTIRPNLLSEDDINLAVYRQHIEDVLGNFGLTTETIMEESIFDLM
jgi:DNA polymerase elongation subunit (family B)